MSVTLLVPGKLVESYGRGASELANEVPIDHIINHIQMLFTKSPSVVSDRLMVLQASTGSGKSTVLPPVLYKRLNSLLGERNIACTQPRILTAKEITNSVLEFNKDLRLGDNIGYQTGIFSKKPRRGIIYMTIGVLYQQLLNFSPEDLMKYYSVIILDEAHERSVNNDVVLYLLKQFLADNCKDSRCPLVIIMSATFNPKGVVDYMLDGQPGGWISVEGNSYPIQETFLDREMGNYMGAITNKVIELHGNTQDLSEYYRDILVFLPGKWEIGVLSGYLVNRISKDTRAKNLFTDHPAQLITLMGEDVKSLNQNYGNIFKDISELPSAPLFFELSGKKLYKPVRRIILASNVAETGLTINTLKYVIDSGWYKSMEYNPLLQIRGLITKPVNKDAHTQRRGRVGRKAPGECHTMFSKGTFEMMEESQKPEIIKDDVTSYILNMICVKCVDISLRSENLHEVSSEKFKNSLLVKNLELRDLCEMDLLDPFPAIAATRAMDRLMTIGFITSSWVPTMLGYIAGKFSKVRPECIKMILSGYAYGASIIDLIYIAAGIDASFRGNVQAKYPFIDPFIAPLYYYHEYLKSDKVESGEGINEFLIELHDDIIKQLASLGFNPYANVEKSVLFNYKMMKGTPDLLEAMKKIKMCIYEGFKLFTAVKVEGSTYRSLYTSVEFSTASTEPYIIYGDIMMKQNMKNGKYINKCTTWCNPCGMFPMGF